MKTLNWLQALIFGAFEPESSHLEFHSPFVIFGTILLGFAETIKMVDYVMLSGMAMPPLYC